MGKSSILTTLHVCVLSLLYGCATPTQTWYLGLHHDAQGKVLVGTENSLVSAIRQGCNLKVAWGTRRKSDPSRSIEHNAQPIWVSLRDGKKVEVQIGDFQINLKVLGELPSAHPERERFGGTEKVVNWRANLKTDGSFDAVWYYPHSGEFITRVPQRFPMKWFVDCPMKTIEPLFL